MKQSKIKRADGRTVTVVEREWAELPADERANLLQQRIANLEAEALAREEKLTAMTKRLDELERKPR